MIDAERLAGVVAFSAVGTITVAQDLARLVLEEVEGADPELVAEETLALVATATARAAAFALRDAPEVARSAGALLADLPMTFHDYLLGGSLLAGVPEADLPADVYPRLGRKLVFYGMHLEDGRLPGPTALADVMALWMGRVSPPGLPEMPAARLERLGLVEVLARHARLVRSHAERSD